MHEMTCVSIKLVTAQTAVHITSLCSATTHADNVALPAFARRFCSSRSISLACRPHISRPAVAGLLPFAHAGTDRRTDGRTPYGFTRCINPAPHSMRAVPMTLNVLGTKRVTYRFRSFLYNLPRF